MLFKLLSDFKNESVDDIKKSFFNKYDSQIDSYFEFLIEKDLGFWCSNPDQFPELDMAWKTPSLITNAIVDFDKNTFHDVESIVNQLNSLGCQAVQFRFFDTVNIDILDSYLKYFHDSRIYDIQLLIKNESSQSFDIISALCERHLRISQIIIHSSDDRKNLRSKNINVPIMYSPEQIIDHNFCGFVSYNHFVVNISNFTESRNYNSCLNKKLGIDVNGNIRNCPAMPDIYGNVRENSIAEIIVTSEFQEVWDLTKDDVEVCKTCEFRYICQDCRAFTIDGKKKTKPIKCNYDPHEAKWAS